MDAAVPAGFELIDLGSGFGQSFGPIYVNEETSTLAFRVAANHLNWVDGCHGGAMATFADFQIVAVKSRLGKVGNHLPTINISVDFLAPVPAGSWVEAAVTLVKVTRTLIFTQAIMTVGGVAVARATGLYRNWTPGSRSAVPIV